MSDVELGPLTLFSARRSEVVRFYREVAGLAPDDTGDATWFDVGDGRIAVRDSGDRQTPPEVRSQPGVVVWLGVPDVAAVFERARVAGAQLGDFHGDYFFARDPDGRIIGFFAQEGQHGHDHEH